MENSDPAGCDWFVRPPEPPDDSTGTNGAAPGGGSGTAPAVPVPTVLPGA
jgi:hypothetical protein